jgi:hypothetical protein
VGLREKDQEHAYDQPGGERVFTKFSHGTQLELHGTLSYGDKDQDNAWNDVLNEG